MPIKFEPTIVTILAAAAGGMTGSLIGYLSSGGDDLSTTFGLVSGLILGAAFDSCQIKPPTPNS